MNNKKTKIVMNAMVANEAKTITRMLESVYPYIDYWVVQDNGSVDGTQDIIRNFFKEKNIPGFLYETEWKFPGYNRDHALQECIKADHGCDWILRMDADERLEVDEDFDWSLLDNTEIDSWNIIVRSFDTKYFRTWLWNAKRPWFFQHDKRHETIHLPDVGENFQRVSMPYGFRHLVSQDGNTWLAPRKFLRDALELEIDKVVGDKVHEDYYHLWYIAKSYADCYGNSSELPFGRKHSEEYARRSIWYYERFLELTHKWNESKTAKYGDEMAYFGLIVMGWAYEFIGDQQKAEESYKLAGQFSTRRNEHYLYLAFYYERLGMFDRVLETIDLMAIPERTNPFPDLAFLIEDRCYLNTSNFLNEFKEKITNKMGEHFINSESFTFDFK